MEDKQPDNAYESLLWSTRDKMEDLRIQLAYLNPSKLAHVEETLCHLLNDAAGTPCFESWPTGLARACPICGPRR